MTPAGAAITYIESLVSALITQADPIVFGRARLSSSGAGSWSGSRLSRSRWT